MAAAKKISAEEFDRRFDDGEDMTDYLDWSRARRPGLVSKDEMYADGGKREERDDQLRSRSHDNDGPRSTPRATAIVTVLLAGSAPGLIGQASRVRYSALFLRARRDTLRGRAGIRRRRRRKEPRSAHGQLAHLHPREVKDPKRTEAVSPQRSYQRRLAPVPGSNARAEGGLRRTPRALAH